MKAAGRIISKPPAIHAKKWKGCKGKGIRSERSKKKTSESLLHKAPAGLD
jgi:hypothetical protein